MPGEPQNIPLPFFNGRRGHQPSLGHRSSPPSRTGRLLEVGRHRARRGARLPSLSTSNLCQTQGLAAIPGSCCRVVAMTNMTRHAVVIAGGGPTGLMLAGELALAQVDVAIVERRANQDLAGSRAGGLHSRTIEVLDQRGIAERFLSQGKVMQVAGFAMVPLDISDFPTRHNYGLALWQDRIERILAGWVDELAVPIYRGLEVTGFAQDDTGVDVEHVRRPFVAGEVPRRMRRRSEPRPQESRHRLPGMGPVHQLLDCRGRDDRRAGVGHPPGRKGRQWPGQTGGREARAGGVERAARR